jgi:hypothetical protein
MVDIDYYETLGLDSRMSVLVYSLIIENATSFFLGKLMDIENINDSKILGNKSGCISFNQKIAFLIEMKIIPPIEKKKFRTFMEIRNQFMHNIDATSFTKCFSFLNGTDNFILNSYPQEKDLSKEEQLKNATMKMSSELLNVIMKIKKSE